MDSMTAVFWLVWVGTAGLALYVADLYREGGEGSE